MSNTGNIVCTVCNREIQPGERRKPAFGATAHDKCIPEVIEKAGQRLHISLESTAWLTDINDARPGMTVKTYQGEEFPITDYAWAGDHMVIQYELPEGQPECRGAPDMNEDPTVVVV